MEGDFFGDGVKKDCLVLMVRTVSNLVIQRSLELFLVHSNLKSKSVKGYQMVKDHIIRIIMIHNNNICYKKKDIDHRWSIRWSPVSKVLRIQ